MRHLFVILFLILPSLAWADSCFAPPALQNPQVCDVGTSGGSCSFGPNEDGIVKFPDTEVTGPVWVQGGRNIVIGPGKIRNMDGTTKTILSLNNLSDAAHVYIEGMDIDANNDALSSNSDVLAIRNQYGINQTVTLVNNYFHGQDYGSMEHGDLIQNQGENMTGSLALNIQNFLGRPHDAQGFFIPDRTTDGSQNSVQMENVYILPEAQTFTYPMLWFWAQQYDSRDLKYPVILNNVWVYSVGQQLYPTDWANDSHIAGTIGDWASGGPSDPTAEYVANTGLNYNRAYFCGATATTTTSTTTPDTSTSSNTTEFASILNDYSRFNWTANQDSTSRIQRSSTTTSSPDSEPPTVTLLSPTKLVQRNSDELIEVAATDNVGVLRVEVSINGIPYAVLEDTWTVAWTVPNDRYGRYEISAMAIDLFGNYSTTSIKVFSY